MNKLVVPRLERLAFEKAYKELLGTLILCREHRPQWKQHDLVEDSSLIPMLLRPYFLTSEKVITFVKNHLAQTLVGVMNDKIRKELVEKFYETFKKSNENIIAIQVFLECLLDESFEELDTHISYPDGEPSAEVITTIANHSSQLKKLKIDFSQMKRGASVEKVNLVISSLISLEQLSTLHLFEIGESHKAVLKYVGNACPLLSHFSISGFCVSSTDILAIVVGEHVDKLFPSFDYLMEPSFRENLLTNLLYIQVAPEILTAFCSTLRRLQLGNPDWYEKKLGDCWVRAFVLRYVPLLEKIDGHTTFISIKHLKCSLCTRNDSQWPNTLESLKAHLSDHISQLGYQISEEKLVGEARRILKSDKKKKKQEMKMTANFERASKEIIASRKSASSSPSSSIEHNLLVRPTFSGTLLLTSLDCVSLRHGSMLPVIKEMCPNLKDVVFYQLWPDERLGGYNTQADELEEKFNGWPELETITLAEMFHMEYTRAVLKVFAPNVKNLTFKHCEEVDLADLVACTQLESLQLITLTGRYGRNTLSPRKDDQESWNLPSFLPQLKSIQSDICLGQWATLFEKKPTLTRIVLNCCHFGVLGLSSLGWNSVPKMWPSLEILRVGRCEGLDISILSDIVPQLGKLKELSFPEGIIGQEEKIAAAIMVEDLRNRSAPIDLHFQDVDQVYCCPLIQDTITMMFGESEGSEQDDSQIE